MMSRLMKLETEFLPRWHMIIIIRLTLSWSLAAAIHNHNALVGVNDPQYNNVHLPHTNERDIIILT